MSCLRMKDEYRYEIVKSPITGLDIKAYEIKEEDYIKFYNRSVKYIFEFIDVKND